jgi:hypothetical protein
MSISSVDSHLRSDLTRLLAFIGNGIGVVLIVYGCTRTWYDEFVGDGYLPIDGWEAGAYSVVILAIAMALATVALLIDFERSRWLLGATFSLSAVAAAFTAQGLARDDYEPQEGFWFVMYGAATIATMSAVAFALTQLPLRTACFGAKCQPALDRELARASCNS